MFNPRKSLEYEVIRVKEMAQDYDVGSDEYLNACKATNQLAEAAQKCKRVDLNVLIPGVSSVGMFVIYMIFSDTHITDTRGIQFIKGLFKK